MSGESKQNSLQSGTTASTGKSGQDTMGYNFGTPYGATGGMYDSAFNQAANIFNKTNNLTNWDALLSQGVEGATNNAQTALRADPLGGAMKSFANTYGNDGYNGEMRSAISALQPTMRGDYLTRTDPNFERLLGSATSRAATEAAMAAGASGRAGSPYAQDTVARAVGDLEANARLGQYNTERDRQTNAISQMFGFGSQGMNNLGNAGNVWSSLYSGANAPAQDLIQLGQMPTTSVNSFLSQLGTGSPYAGQTQKSSGNTWESMLQEMQQTGQQTSKEPTNWAGLLGGGLLGGLSLLRGGL